MTVKEVVAAAIMAVAIFAFSNLSFLNENAPFASRERADSFFIRTLIDLEELQSCMLIRAGSVSMLPRTFSNERDAEKPV